MKETFIKVDVVEGINIYRFLKNNRTAVDAFLVLMDEHATQHTESVGVQVPMVYIIDVSQSGMFSIAYMQSKAASLISKHNRQISSYIAYIVDDLRDSVLVDMINMITARQIQSTRKIFLLTQMDEAIAWATSVLENLSSDS